MERPERPHRPERPDRPDRTGGDGGYGAPAWGGRPATLLAIGDVHLGTRPGGLAPELADAGVDAAEITPEAALAAAVERAVAERVDAVLFAGDVVESTNARFEALRPLEAAVGRLLAAGIPVLAVAGNHDVEALPRLAERIEGFRLLGAGGGWERHVLEGEGRPALEVLGWSFPEARVAASPVAELLRSPPPPAPPGVARIGLLHGDLDASGGHHAPFRRRELEQAGLDAWLLGHIHAPSLGGAAARHLGGGRAGSGAGGVARPAPGGLVWGYLGSLLPLDPTETGLHGPWRVRVHAGGRVEAEPLPNGLLRWERVDIPVGEAGLRKGAIAEGGEGPTYGRVGTGPPDGAAGEGTPARDVATAATAASVADAVLDAACARAREIRAAGEAPRLLGIRARLVGRTRHYAELRRWIEGGGWRGPLVRDVGETLVFVESVADGMELAVDLEGLARGDDPPALLARRLLVLERGGEGRRALLDAARERLRPVAREATWDPLAEARSPEDPLADEPLAALLHQSGIALLDALLAQRAQRPRGEEREA